jgi:hypothetical protein
MACKVYRYGHNGVPVDEGHQPGELKEMIFSCDADGCDVKADDDHIAGSGGLRYMGWWASGGKHFCPTHFDQGGETQW